MYRYVILAVALLALGEANKDFKCPWVIGKYPFDEAKFAGEWYAVSTTSFKESGEENKKCAKMSINALRTGSESSLEYKMSAIVDDKPIFGELFSKAFMADKSSMSYGVYKKDEPNAKWTGVYKQSIVATDYDTYAVMIACKPDFDEATKKFSRNLFAGIYSRKTDLPEEILKTLKNLISGYDIDITDMKTMDHTGCDAKLKI